jgi:hypothetical protein
VTQEALRTLRQNIARLSAATYASIVEYMRMPLWQLIEIAEDVEAARKKK